MLPCACAQLLANLELSLDILMAMSMGAQNFPRRSAEVRVGSAGGVGRGCIQSSRRLHEA